MFVLFDSYYAQETHTNADVLPKSSSPVLNAAWGSCRLILFLHSAQPDLHSKKPSSWSTASLKQVSLR